MKLPISERSMQEVVDVRRIGLELTVDEIEERVFNAVESIGGLPSKIESADSIMVKPNIGHPDVREHKGHQVALTEPCVTRAILQMIRVRLASRKLDANNNSERT